VGSHAHGLATPESDYDYRGVFVVPTREILSLGSRIKNTNWIEGNVDDTSWEVGHFLNLAVHCNPTILEVFAAPKTPKDCDPYWGDQLAELFDYLWNPNDVKNAFMGYSHNQQKKFLDGKDAKSAKFACAYLRVLVQADFLLTYQKMLVDFRDTPVYNTLVRWKAWKQEDIDYGEVMSICKYWEGKVLEAYDRCKSHTPDINKVNDYLLRVRQRFW